MPIPGLEATDPNLGNLIDVGKAGSLQNFLVQLHADHGDIASFYFGPQYVVSIASPKLFEEHSHVFDRPECLFALFQDFITKDCLQYANGEDGKRRRALYDKCFTGQPLDLYYPIIQKNADELVKELSVLSSDDKMPLTKHMMALSVKTLAQVGFGGFFDSEDKVKKLETCYETCWKEMEMRLLNNFDAARIEQFKKCLQELHDLFAAALGERKSQASKEGHLYIDALLESGLSQDVMEAECLMFLVAAFHTSAMALTWVLYELAINQDMQEKVAAEAKQHGPVNPQNIQQFKYTTQVIMETLRKRVLVPYVGRVEDTDREMGGHTIPANTPVIQAIGVVMHNEAMYPNPSQFDPDRFRDDKIAARPKLSYEPFGFSGNRQCLGKQFSYIEIVIVLVTLTQKYKFHLDLDNEVKVDYGLVTKPVEEIMVAVQKRD